jgi:hypothetical protein
MVKAEFEVVAFDNIFVAAPTAHNCTERGIDDEIHN